MITFASINVEAHEKASHEHADETCDLFRDNQPVTMPVGMRQHFYHDMPGYIQVDVKEYNGDINQFLHALSYY